MMIQVVIADDEAKVCQLIRGLIDWASLGMEIAGVAYNGIEALELVEALRPDLVITDIRMPGYDGLELLRRAKEISPALDFVIISGYRHFEYAQSAVKYGVCDYLLKPIKKDELLETLGKISEKHRLRTARLSAEEQMKLRLKSDMDKLRAGLFTDLLAREAAGAEAEPAHVSLERINADYRFRFRAGLFQMFIVKLDCDYERFSQSGIKNLEDKAEQMLRGQLGRRCFDMEICFQGSRAYGVLNYAAGDRETVRRQLKSTMDELSLRNSIFENVTLTTGLGCAVPEIGALGESLRSARSAVAGRLLEGAGKLLDEKARAGTAFRGDALLADMSRAMQSALEVFDEEAAVAAADTLCRQAAQTAGIDGQTLFRLVSEAYSVYEMLLRNLRLGEGGTEVSHENFLRRADLCASAETLFTCLSDAIRITLEETFSERRQADKKPIRAAKQYIQQNYMQPISLEEVSGVVNFNAAYFSSLFKKESGQNFSEYLTGVRMEKAKELLKETSLGIAAVCEQVGYSDLKHFTRLFKKYTGLKPNEFRKLYA